MNSTIRLILAVVAAAVAGLMAPDVFHLLPLWAQVTAGVMSASLAAVMVPPQYVHLTPGVDAIQPTTGNTITRTSNSGDSTVTPFEPCPDCGGVGRNDTDVPPELRELLAPPCKTCKGHSPTHPWTPGLTYDGRNSLQELLRE